MVWAGISLGEHTGLPIIWNRNLTARRYSDKILRLHVLPFLQPLMIPFFGCRMKPDLIQLVLWRTFLKLKQSVYGVSSMLPLTLSDQACLGWTIHCCKTKIHSYCPSLRQEWDSIPQSLINNLFTSMLDRCTAVLAVGGTSHLIKHSISIPQNQFSVTYKKSNCCPKASFYVLYSIREN
ncbi:hypothetical protein TNCV_4978451 [Trichonephila clavipes]|nr:hypothetical protein TNCV_4978451 [Trichonephila clavipes]